MNSKTIINYLFYSVLIAAIYYGAGIVVKPLILPLTFSAPIWPQAGLSIGILLLWGYKYLPALLVGEILTNYNFYKFDQIQDNPYLLVTYALMLVAMIVRSVLGVYLVKKSLGRSNNILTLESVVKLFFYAGLLPTLIAAILSTYALNLNNLLDKDFIFTNFFTWWYGDSVGVFIVLPLMFLIFKKPRNVWKPRLYKTAIPVGITFLLILLISFYLKEFEYSRLIKAIKIQTVELVQELQLKIPKKTASTNGSYTSKEPVVNHMNELINKDQNNDIYYLIQYKKQGQYIDVFENKIKHKKSSKWSSTKEFDMSGTTWRVKLAATSKFFLNNASWLVWWLTSVGFLFIALVAGALLVITGNTLMTKATVEKRTKEINLLNEILIERERQYKQLVEVNPVIFWKHIIGSEKFDFISDEAVNILGYSKEELSNYDIVWNKMFHPKDRNKVLKNYYKGIKSGKSFNLKYRGVKKNGEIIWFKDYISSQVIDGKLEVIGLKIDVTKDQESEEKIAQLAYYDSMTKLPNRTKFMEYLFEAIELSKAGSTLGAVLYLDLDRFKVLNDSMGHYFGDQLLIQIGERLKSTLRKTDISSRFGGDEFVVLIRNQNDTLKKIRAKALHVAEKIQAFTRIPFEIDGHEFFTTFSIGISIFPFYSNEANKILQQADIAMYESKTKGKNTISFFEPEMQLEANKRLNIEKSMKFALEKQEFEMYYQPIFDIDKKIIRLEALIRWNHPVEGLLTPDYFIKIAEETGLIVELSVWIIDNVFGHMNHLKESGQIIIPVSINVSLFQFKNTKIIEDIERIANKHNIETSLVALELTESVGIENLDDAIEKLNKLKELGFKIAIDDFGSGYSSLNYLTKMPIDMLKLDRSFLASLDNESNAETLIEIILLMAKKLNLEIVVEGVETQQQFELLKKLDCKAFQGHLYSKAVTYEQITVLLKKEL